jgi:cell division septation protein DedD
MSADVKTLTKDIQDRIRDLAYLMWESAGKQQNMALQYWLNAELEVLSSMQAATEVMLPARGQRRKAAQSPAQPAAQSSVDPIEASQAEARTTTKTPAEPKPKSRQPTDTQDTAEAAASADFETPATRPTPRKAGGRRKTTM